MRRVCITGGAGFIGSTLADRLRDTGIEVVIVDDFRTGRREFIADQLVADGAELIEGDVLDRDLLKRAFDGCDWVFHLQANADVRFGLEHPQLDLEQNTIATAGVLEAMRAVGVKQIAFASTGSIYGEPDVFPTPEHAPFPTQTSLYGASIMPSPASFDFTAVVLRFVSILGERYTHGHVFDFYRALKTDPDRLFVLGDGHQEKSYLHVHDCVDAMLLTAREHEGSGDFCVYNLGTDETILLNSSIAEITQHMGVDPAIDYAGGVRGWPGDSPLIHLDCTKIRQLGWTPTLDVRESIARTLAWLDANTYVWKDAASGGPRK